VRTNHGFEALGVDFAIDRAPVRPPPIDPVELASKHPRPRAATWSRLRPFERDGIIVGAYYRHGRLIVISSRVIADYPTGRGMGLQDHVSVSVFGIERRANAREAGLTCLAFGMSDAEEDNHEPGRARHFWRPVDPAHRVACECKTDEEQIVEPDGHVWSNPVDGPCRGCSFELMSGRPCPIHKPGARR
jgi:hypothetical protein